MDLAPEAVSKAVVEVVAEPRLRDMLTRGGVKLPAFKRPALAVRLLQHVHCGVTSSDYCVEHLLMARRYAVAHIRRPGDVREHRVLVWLASPQVYQHPVAAPYHR